jgi:hypothetical protein
MRFILIVVFIVKRQLGAPEAMSCHHCNQGKWIQELDARVILDKAVGLVQIRVAITDGLSSLLCRCWLLEVVGLAIRFVGAAGGC